MKESNLKLRIKELEKRLHDLEMKLRFEVLPALRDLATTTVNIQPVLGRLISMSVILETKGLITNEEYLKVTEQQADKFIEAANPNFIEKVRGKSQVKPVVGDNGTKEPIISGTSSNREPEASDKLTEAGHIITDH